MAKNDLQNHVPLESEPVEVGETVVNGYQKLYGRYARRNAVTGIVVSLDGDDAFVQWTGTTKPVRIGRFKLRRKT